MVKLLFNNGKHVNETCDESDFNRHLNSFLEKKNKLQNFSTLELVMVFDCLSKTISSFKGDNALLIKNHNLGFIIPWLKKSNIRSTLINTFGAVDVFSITEETKSIKRFAVPRGVITHWIAGNVPVLGFISLFQGILSKNKNIIKVPKSYSDILPRLLKLISKYEYDINSKTIFVKDIIESVLVIYADAKEKNIHESISKISDSRVAWGGKEAIESIINLKKKINCNDIIFGPKESIAIISKESLGNAKQSKLIAEGLANDITIFNQYGCNSPHNVY